MKKLGINFWKTLVWAQCSKSCFNIPIVVFITNPSQHTSYDCTKNSINHFFFFSSCSKNPIFFYLFKHPNQKKGGRSRPQNFSRKNQVMTKSEKIILLCFFLQKQHSRGKRKIWMKKSTSPKKIGILGFFQKFLWNFFLPQKWWLLK